MNIFCFMIAPNVRRELVVSLADLKFCRDMNGSGPDTTEEQDQLMLYFNDTMKGGDLDKAYTNLSQMLPYRGVDDSGEYQVGISTTSMEAAKLLALDELLENIDNEH